MVIICNSEESQRHLFCSCHDALSFDSSKRNGDGDLPAEEHGNAIREFSFITIC